nr:GNAT family N-acetyltransferase [uncultured Agathobaculum sp.]
MKHMFVAEYKNCRIRPVLHRDIEFFRVWRNNTSLSKYLTPIGEITPQMQEEWFNKNQADTDIVTFSVDETRDYNRVVGSASLYNFSGHTAEVGKTIIGDDEARGKSLGFYSELMTVYVGFVKLQLEEIIAHIHEDNIASMKRAKRLGYTIIDKYLLSSGGFECKLMTTKKQFINNHPDLSEIRIFEIS